MRGDVDSGRDFQVRGRFMYADYSPLEDDRNLVEVIKEFVALSSKLGRIDVNNRKLKSLLSDSDRLRADIITAIKSIKTNTTSTMEKFYDEHSDLFANDLMSSGAAILVETKNSLSELLGSTEAGFDQQHSKYKEKIQSGINKNIITSSELVESWLASDYRNLPRPIVSDLYTAFTASIGMNPSKTYSITRTTKSATAATTLQSASEIKRDNSAALQFSYTFQIDTSDLEFWSHRKTVSELGIKELALPKGLKASTTEKIKQTFRFGSRKDAEIPKEAEFVKVDNYNLARATLQADRTLEIELAKDIERSDGERFRISYDVASLSGQNSSSGLPRPKLQYLSNEFGSDASTMDLLQIDEVAKSSDIAKIRLLGAAVLSRVKVLQSAQIVQSRGRLQELRVNENVVIPSAIQKSEFGSLFGFLEAIAPSFSPFIKKMKEKTQVAGELTLREEIGGGQRKEFSVRVDDLKSQLDDTDHGRRMISALAV
jgi:hypothetical protein